MAARRPAAGDPDRGRRGARCARRRVGRGVRRRWPRRRCSASRCSRGVTSACSIARRDPPWCARRWPSRSGSSTASASPASSPRWSSRPTACVAALFGFNAGVEVGTARRRGGDLAAAARAARAPRDGRWYGRVAESGSAAICGLGLFWFVTRTLRVERGIPLGGGRGRSGRGYTGQAYAQVGAQRGADGFSSRCWRAAEEQLEHAGSPGGGRFWRSSPRIPASIGDPRWPARRHSNGSARSIEESTHARAPRGARHRSHRPQGGRTRTSHRDAQRAARGRPEDPSARAAQPRASPTKSRSATAWSPASRSSKTRPAAAVADTPDAIFRRLGGEL